MELNNRKEASLITFIKKLREFRKEVKNIDNADKVFEKCEDCGNIVSEKKIRESSFTCPDCNYHFNISAKNRMDMLLDRYKVINRTFRFSNPIDFPGYKEVYKKNKRSTGIKEGILTVEGYLKDIKLIAISLDNRFLMGSMGSYIGEEITRAFEHAGKNNLPIVIFSTSGGARMQEGIFSLMQMAKTSIAVGRYGETKNLYVSCMTNPTTGGVTASFASLGDINLAEPGALIGFAGPRVIKETIQEELPEGFQRAEFLKDKGFLDDIVHRNEMKEYLYTLLKLHGYRG